MADIHVLFKFAPKNNGKEVEMGEIVLSWVKCEDCAEWFPVVADNEDLETIENLEKSPKYCPFCGSINLSFSDLSTEYYG